MPCCRRALLWCVCAAMRGARTLFWSVVTAARLLVLAVLLAHAPLTDHIIDHLIARCPAGMGVVLDRCRLAATIVWTAIALVVVLAAGVNPELAQSVGSGPVGDHVLALALSVLSAARAFLLLVARACESVAHNPLALYLVVVGWLGWCLGTRPGG